MDTKIFINLPVKDLDGHQWELGYMDLSKFPQQ